MKYKNVYFVLASAALFIASCKKTDIPSTVAEEASSTSMTNGLPEDRTAINGYLYANYISNGNGSFSSIVNYAVFGDNARNLMSNFNHYSEQSSTNTSTTNPDRGNVNVGTISFSGNMLYQSASGTAWSYFMQQQTTNKNPVANWKSDGNKSFKSMDLYVNRGFPIVSDTLLKSSTTITVSAGHTIALGSQVKNYDSLIVCLTSYNTPTVQVRKVFTPGSPVVFSKQELDTLKNRSYVNVYLRAINYSNMTSNGKKYIFELSRKSAEQFNSVTP
jgi:hypothetical protein